eukprot:CAMPEP_0206455370 /NCGR_PEP_ID=MMETSP0324_2-20121206/21709_1 /ASSEMBLY_ACC=CAM_ASM_000836 /TAXON_ID=2866 /ORGANISM="Crypthecodinium cohnii, Strain Seligo" /LENGTH=601 /DNA_ID=CAMNT_0053926055 /DNA_START=194 /DNA_END=1997 /DNA_ORIENTATION=-
MMMGGAQQAAPGVFVLNKNTKREQGRKAQLTNIQAGKTVASIVRTTLGPRAMLKMLLDPMGGIVMTNDGNAILREVDVTHPAAKNMIELSRAQDEEVGDGTTSVIVLAGEFLGVAEPLLEKKLHPTLIVGGYMQALDDAVAAMKEIADPIDVNNPEAVRDIVRGCIDTKFVSRYGTLISDLAIKATQTVCITHPDGRKEIDLKRYAKVEKLSGGELSDSMVLDGVMFNKDITHPRMRRIIKNPRVVLLDCPLEYKKGESQTSVEITKDTDWEKLLQQEEDEMKKVCDDIIKVKPDVVITEKGVSDLAQHFLLKANISVIRRIRKTDNNRIARVTGASICNRTEELTEAAVGSKCGLFQVKKIGDEYFTFMTQCEDPKACSVILRGASRDVLNEMERNLQDAFGVARNITLEPRMLPGGGATEMALAARLKEKAKAIPGTKQFAYKAVAEALEVIPRSLAHNCGADVVRVMTDLRARHAAPGGTNWGIDGNKGVVADVKSLGIMDTFAVKQQTLRTSLEAAAMLLRIDDIISGISKKQRGGGGGGGMPTGEEETFGDARDGKRPLQNGREDSRRVLYRGRCRYIDEGDRDTTGPVAQQQQCK